MDDFLHLWSLVCTVFPMNLANGSWSIISKTQDEENWTNLKNVIGANITCDLVRTVRGKTGSHFSKRISEVKRGQPTYAIHHDAKMKSPSVSDNQIWFCSSGQGGVRCSRVEKQFNTCVNTCHIWRLTSYYNICWDLSTRNPNKANSQPRVWWVRWYANSYSKIKINKMWRGYRTLFPKNLGLQGTHCFTKSVLWC